MLLTQSNHCHLSHLDILKDNSTYSSSYKYNNVHSHLSISADCWYASQLTMQVKILLGESCYSTHQAVIRFVEHYIDMVSCVHRKFRTQAGDINKSFECVTITDGKFSNRVLVRMTPKSTSINVVTIWLEQLDFCLHRCILPTEFCLMNCFLIFLSSRQSSVVTSPRKRNSSTKQSSAFPTLTLVEYHLVIALVRPAYILFLLCCIQCHEVQ